MLNPKKKVWETIQPLLFTNDQRLPYYRYVKEEGAPEQLCLLQTAKGQITVKTNVKATIK